MLFPKSGKDASQPGRQVTMIGLFPMFDCPSLPTANPCHRVAPILVPLEVPSEVIDLVMILAAAIWNCLFPPTRMANFECSCWETETANRRKHWYDRFLCIQAARDGCRHPPNPGIHRWQIPYHLFLISRVADI